MLCKQLDNIILYREILKGEDNGDVLWGDASILSDNPLVLHLHVSTDGGSLYRYKNCSYWPFHAVLLDLTPYERNTFENYILLGLWASRKKPTWEIFVSDYLKYFPFNEVITINLGTKQIDIILKLHTATFDLPAQASILNKTQYNGRFGCLFCNLPGVQFRVGNGSARKYPSVGEIYSDEEFARIATIAHNTKETLFGIKGISALHGYMSIPSHIVIDSLHTMYENCTKNLLSCYLDSKYFRFEFYLGRHANYLNNIMKRV